MYLCIQVSGNISSWPCTTSHLGEDYVGPCGATLTRAGALIAPDMYSADTTTLISTPVLFDPPRQLFRHQHLLIDTYQDLILCELAPQGTLLRHGLHLHTSTARVVAKRFCILECLHYLRHLIGRRYLARVEGGKQGCAYGSRELFPCHHRLQPKYRCPVHSWCNMMRHGRR